MNNAIKYVGVYILGVATGAAAGAFYFSKKYKSEYRKTVDSFKSSYKKERKGADARYRKPEVKPHEPIKKDDIPDTTLKDELEALAAKYKNTYEDIPSYERPKYPVEVGPYVIEEDMYGENEDYEQIDLTYYADQKLADDEDDLIEKPVDILGETWKDRFDKYDEDVVYVRNDSRKADYCITRDLRKYTDVVEDKPYLIHNVFDSAMAALEEEEE